MLNQVSNMALALGYQVNTGIKALRSSENSGSGAKAKLVTWLLGHAT
jgi:hypothetical protein